MAITRRGVHLGYKRRACLPRCLSRHLTVVNCNFDSVVSKIHPVINFVMDMKASANKFGFKGLDLERVHGFGA